MVSLKRCEACGHYLWVRSLERVYAANHLVVELGQDGQAISADWGMTEPDWESAETVEYQCAACFKPVSEEQAFVLDRLLGNRRLRDEGGMS